MGSALAGIRRVRRFAESEPRVDTVMVPGLRADEARAIADEIDGLHSELATLRSQLAARTKALDGLVRRVDSHFGGPERSADWIEQVRARASLAQGERKP